MIHYTFIIFLLNVDVQDAEESFNRERRFIYLFLELESWSSQSTQKIWRMCDEWIDQNRMSTVQLRNSKNLFALLLSRTRADVKIKTRSSFQILFLIFCSRDVVVVCIHALRVLHFGIRTPICIGSYQIIRTPGRDFGFQSGLMHAKWSDWSTSRNSLQNARLKTDVIAICKYFFLESVPILVTLTLSLWLVRMVQIHHS